MEILSKLKDTHRRPRRRKEVGRGVGSGHGKTSCRGHKGDKSRSGYKRRAGNEGGQGPLYQKKPTRGFNQEKFRKEVYSLNLDRIDDLFEDGEVVSIETCKDKGFISKESRATLKVLSNGELNKKVTINAHAFSKQAVLKLEKAAIEFNRV